MLKATIYFKCWSDGKRHQKTFFVEKNEPCHIVRKARNMKYLGYNDYVTSIKCGRYNYLDYGYAEPSVHRAHMFGYFY